MCTKTSSGLVFARGGGGGQLSAVWRGVYYKEIHAHFLWTIAAVCFNVENNQELPRAYEPAGLQTKCPVTYKLICTQKYVTFKRKHE